MASVRTTPPEPAVIVPSASRLSWILTVPEALITRVAKEDVRLPEAIEMAVSQPVPTDIPVEVIAPTPASVKLPIERPLTVSVPAAFVAVKLAMSTIE